MNVFCHYIRQAILEMFHLDVDVYVSRKKDLVHFAFKKPLSSIQILTILFSLFLMNGERENFFFANYKMIYPMLIPSLKWKYDYVFFKKVTKK